MIDCSFQPDGDKYRCEWCNFVAPLRELRRNCPARNAQPRPNIVNRAVNYTKARLRWETAGRPIRADEEQAALLAICEACHYYQDETCTRCGCPVGRRTRFGNKLAWATESCPVGRW